MIWITILNFFISSIFFTSCALELDVDVCLNEVEVLLYNKIYKYRKDKNLDPIPFSAKLTM
ncbi:MAG: hypothetical protein R3345_02765, partial [Fulvivirga sp.]|nr:hypothetical protein [Fulvivirga sp.]